jgi:hypothetical protein
MSHSISTGGSVSFIEPPKGIVDRIYEVVHVVENVLPNEDVCVISAPGVNPIAALESELKPTH